jgi:hypothetical protein
MAILHEPGYLASRVYTLSRKEANRMHAAITPLTLALLLALTLAVPARAGGEPAPVGIAPPRKRLPDPPPPQPAGEPVSNAEVPREVRRAVVADAARRLNVAENLVVLTAAERVTWSDGALGCPEPGMNYSQALVPGFRITAKSAQGGLVYHTDANGNLARCDTSLHRRERSDPGVAPKPVEPRTGPPPGRTAPDR